MKEKDENLEENTKQQPEEKEQEKPDPTRYGDWEKDGRCIDF
jgi:hypothetical protein